MKQEHNDYTVKAYLFDYGGTLDTAGCHWVYVIWEAIKKLQIPITEEQFREAYVFAERKLGEGKDIKASHTFRETLLIKVDIELNYLVERGYIHIEKTQLESWKAQIVNNIYESVTINIKESIRVLNVLKQKYRLGLVSNFYGNIKTVLEEFGLASLFDIVIESESVGIRKPDEAIYQLAIDGLGLKASEVCVVGDSYKNDMAPAIKLGCRAIWLKGKAWQEEDNMYKNIDKIIYTLKELL